ncbi:hypothetical protein [Flavobacterium sp. 25HG05S-40]|uniref:hypothetical protein n=1 Tax=Flavobacterium sp. 25HG05S-40 TaxID=3458682 RepID=UPI004044CF2A
MTNNEIKETINQNSAEKNSIYLNIVLDKCNAVSKEGNVIALVMLLLILLYYLADATKSGSVEIGPLSFSNLNAIKIFIPLVFAFLIFRFVLLSAHKAELHKIVKEYTIEFFNYKNPIQNDVTQMDDFTRSLLPFSLFSELGTLSYKGKSKLGCFGALLIFPIILFSFIPFLLEFYWIKEFVLKYDSLNATEKWSINITIWIIALSIYYFIHNIIINIKENRVQ